MVGRRMSLKRMLQTSSRGWDREQTRKLYHTGARQYRALLKYDGWYSEPAVLHFGMLVQPCVDAGLRWNCVPPAARSNFTRCLAFRLVSRAALTCFDLLVWPERLFPFRIFQLLNARSKEDAQRIRKELVAKPCLLDPVSREYFTRYPASQVFSPAARGELQMRAALTDICIARVEARWSECRRLINMQGLQTHAPEVEYISAKLLRRGIRVRRGARESEFSTPGIGLSQRSSRTENAPKSEKNERKPRQRRAYSAWAAFQAQRFRDAVQAGEDLRHAATFVDQVSAAAREWQAMGPEERQPFVQKAAIATRR
eukprot:3344733-Pyramimonas_sp.AAC.1